MRIRRLVMLAAALMMAFPGRASDYTFNYNSRCAQAYQAYLSLRLEAGDALIRQEFAASPHNLMATYLADYGDFLMLLFNGDPEEYRQRQAHQEDRLQLLDRADDSEPWKRLSRAGIYLHWALLHIRAGENFKAATTFRKSYLLLQENAGRFPDFAPNNIYLGMEEAMAGAIPDDYKWVASVFGVKGDVRKGIARMASYADTHRPADPLQDEAVIYYQYLRFYLLFQQEAAWKYISGPAFPVKGNLLHAFVRANLALNYRKASDALQTLREARAIPGYDLFPSFDYELGNALCYGLDAGCIPYLERFISRNKGQLFNKDALQKIALSWYLQGNRATAAEKRREILRSGSVATDADKQALRFARDDHWPDPALLQARLLIDGGYYAQALARLTSINIQSYTSNTDRLEYAFRLGRSYEESGEGARALQWYQYAINNGKDLQEHFAARAALQMAFIYERLGQKKEALQYFRISLGMRHHDFQASIDQQAKAGINRLSGN